MNVGQENHDLPFPLLRCRVTLGIHYSVEARLSRWKSFEALFRWLPRRGGQSHTAVADACVSLAVGSRMPLVMRRGESRTYTTLCRSLGTGETRGLGHEALVTMQRQNAGSRYGRPNCVTV